ncbi:DNA repair protein RecO [Bdellovibrio sp. HCB337]|uniref:DNA repair protein RecO n=1 Tax=Bdellovibrio sp. HCB337 TaxID=3394358 RepID=UPI0039A56D95
MEVKDRFIILRTMKYSEADLIVHALSPVGEKLSFIARGALKSKKRFGGGVLEPSHFVQFTYKQASGEGKLNPISEATLLNDFKKIRQDYDHLELALQVIECVSRVSQEGDKSSDSLFNLLGNTLKAIESCQNVAVLKMHFYLKFLFQQGILTTESWMAPFLKTNIGESNSLIGDESLKKEVTKNMFFIESATQQYLKTAENH